MSLVIKDFITLVLLFATGELICIYDDRYHLKDVIVGKIYFLLVRIKIKHMEIAIIKRETTGSGKCFVTYVLDAIIMAVEIVSLTIYHLPTSFYST